MSIIKSLLVSTALVMVTVGASCASPEKIERAAMEHDRRAAEYASYGDYRRAEKERKRAEKQHEKSIDRAEWWGSWRDLY